MAVPKRKVSKSRMRSRKRSHRVIVPTIVSCPQCGSARQPHRLCPSCGYYRGRQVVTVAAD